MTDRYAPIITALRQVVADVEAVDRDARDSVVSEWLAECRRALAGAETLAIRAAWLRTKGQAK